MKEVLDDLLVIKADFLDEIKISSEGITNIRNRVDRIVSERSFLHRRKEGDELASEAATGVFDEQLQRNGIIGPWLRRPKPSWTVDGGSKPARITVVVQ